jgi:hypothetical protein
VTITAIQKHAEAKREVGMRRWAYSNRVADGKMKQEDADLQIAIMEAIAEDYRLPAEAELKAEKEAAEAAKKQLALF